MSLPPPEEILRRLVAQPSVSSADPSLDRSNRAVVDLLADFCDSLGFRVEIQEVSDGPRKANLVATLGDGEGGLVLSGHTDTVPYDEGAWRTDPFDLVADEGGRLFGLGSADMKGFFAAALHAAQAFDAGRLRAPLVLVGTADEETSMAGARALVAAGGPKARFAVIGEPTGLAPVRMHKGIMMERVLLEGRSGHSSDPALGNSALEGMHEVIGVLLEVRDELARAHRHAAFAVPAPTMNLGRIAGGDAPNRICASCVLDVDLRPVPGMVLDEVRALLRRRVAEVAGRRGLNAVLGALFEGVPPFETPADALLVRALEGLTGQASRAVMFGTEGPFLQALGMETVVCGAGSIDVAHQPDEHVDRASLARAQEVYAALVHRVCVEGLA